MTISTTTVNACDAAIWLDNASNVLKDISGSSNNFTLNLTQNTGERRVFGSRWPTRKACGRDAKVDLAVVYSTAADEGLDILKDWFFGAEGAARTLKVYLPDKNVGSDVYSGEFVLDSLEIPATAGEAEPILVTASLLVDGELTLVTNAT